MLYAHTSNPLCERHRRLVEQNLRILMKQEFMNHWVRLLPSVVLTMNCQQMFLKMAIPPTSCSMGGDLRGLSKPLP